MAKKVMAIISCRFGPARRRRPARGPALGQHGVNIMQFVKEYNARTANDVGTVIPVEITVYADRSFAFVTKTPPAKDLLLKAAGQAKGSAQARNQPVGSVTREQIREIAQLKMKDLNAVDIEGAMKQIEVAPARWASPSSADRAPHAVGGRPARPFVHERSHAQARQKVPRGLSLVDPQTIYSPQEAVALVKRAAYAKFDETVEVHLRMNVDPRQADQQLRGVVSLPAGTGKTVRILVFAEGEAAREAEAAGADYVGVDEYVQRIQDGWLEFDVAVASPQVMGRIGRLGRVLGPRGMMPNPRAGTVVQPDDIGRTIGELRGGRVEYASTAGEPAHPHRQVRFEDEALLANWAAGWTPSCAPGPAVRGSTPSVTLASTMGFGVWWISTRRGMRQPSAERDRQLDTPAVDRRCARRSMPSLNE